MSRRTRRPDVHRAPWKDRGWREAPNALTRAEVAQAMVAPVAPPSRLPNDLRSFKVAVTSRSGGGFEAYVKFCEGWAGYCVHGVSASTAMEAKALAVLDHVRVCVQGGTPCA